jgi:hypothetical protein
MPARLQMRFVERPSKPTSPKSSPAVLSKSSKVERPVARDGCNFDHW